MTDAAATSSFLRTRVGGLAREFWVLWAGTLINRMGAMVVPFMTLYLVSGRGLQVLQAGEVMAAFGAGSLVSHIAGGLLADYAGRRVTVLTGTLSTAVCMIALSYARPIPAIIILVLCLGLTIEMHRPATQSLVADLVPAHDRARAYGLLFWAGNLGFAGAMSAAGFFAHTGFGWLFWVDGLTGAAFGLLIWRMVPETGANPQRAAHPAGCEPCSPTARW